MSRAIILVGLCIFILAVECYNNKDVEINSGFVRGHLAEDGDYYTFLGIPYAVVPDKLKRFKAPLPPPNWDNILHANRTVKCPQLGQGEEDCLILNVFTPTKILNGPLPVLVYIHGGSFLFGSGPISGFGPLIKQNVIVVTINYRLGILGFLCLGLHEAPGNAGLKDQIAALKWVNRNIAYFGGDPNQVTVYGMSAGGASVELLLLSELSKDLFQKAIIESGTANSIWSVDATPIETAMNLAKNYKFPKNEKNIYKLLDFYLKFPAQKLSAFNMEYYQNLTDGTFGFVPCVENKLIGTDPVLTMSPRKIYKTNKYHKVPTMFIFSKLEGLFLRSTDYYELNYKDRMNSNFKDFIPGDLIFDTEEIKIDVISNIRRFYFGNNPVGDSKIIEYMNYFGDYMVMNGLLNSVITNSKDNNTVYLLEFAHKGKLGSHDKFFDDINEAGHGDAVKHVILNIPIENRRDKVAVDRMVRIISNFMKFSNPIPNRTDLLPIFWPRVTPDNVTYLRLNDNLQVLEEPQWERKGFWDILYDKYRREIRPVDNRML